MIKFHSEVLDWAKQKWFYPDKYMCDFEKFNETLLAKISSIVHWAVKEWAIKNINMFVLKVRNKFEMKAMKDYLNLHLKCVKSYKMLLR